MKMLFSQRQGFEKVNELIQLDFISEGLKNRLWNRYVHRYNIYNYYDAFIYFYENIFDKFFKEINENINSRNYHPMFARWFLGTKEYDRDINKPCERYDIYNVIEMRIEFLNKSTGADTDLAIDELNKILKEEFSGYRLVDGLFVPITNENEIKSIQNILNTDESRLEGVRIHIKNALEKLSDKINPDYRTSIKESISAVESIYQAVLNEPKKVLSSLSNKIGGKLNLHSQLAAGFKSLYIRTSDDSGIRHGLSPGEQINTDQEDALYMLVSCSAYINYLVTKCDKEGIKIN